MGEQERGLGLLVVKVGGSLFDLPDLGTRLRSWLAAQNASQVVLVPGGGATADVVRDWDRHHCLGEETAHWLALRALAVNAAFLQALLPEAAVIDDLSAGQRVEGRVAILDAHAFALADEGRSGSLPHSWQTTSDAVAARAAVVAGADRLCLLKSATLAEGLSWTAAAELGFVDTIFPAVLQQAPTLRVVAVNLRTWQPEQVRRVAPPDAGPERR